MIIYIIFLFTLAFPALTLAHSRGAAWFMAGLIFLISALRYNVGWDYEAYFEWASHGLDPFTELAMEPLSKWMLELALHSGEPQSFFVLSSAIVVGLFAYSYIRCSPVPTLSILGFFCLPLLFLVSLAIVRQSMAAAVVFFALTVLEKRQKSALLLLILAGLLHYSAWLFILIWPLLRWFERPVATIWLVVAMVSGPLLSPMLVGVIEPYLPLYSGYFQYEGNSGLKLILLYDLLAVFILWLRQLGAPLPPRQLNLFMLGVVLFGFLGTINEVVGRFAYFFMPFVALLLPACMAPIRPVIFVRLLTVFALASLFVLQLHIAAQDPQKDPYQPYQLYPGWFGQLSN
jgi:EpsG family